MKLVELPPEIRTVVAAGDRNYAWGVFLLIASMRRWEMREKILVGAYSWTPEWLEFLEKWPNLKIVRLSTADRRCVCVTKPLLMLQAETPYATWIDSDGMFTGNCSPYLYGEEEALYSRAYSAAELATHGFARKPETIAAWLRDVDSLPERRDIPDICTSVVGVSLERNSALLKRWIEQMDKVLPKDVGIVSVKDSPYFQTDESVLNSLLSCWEPAPPITQCYRLDNPKTAYFAHFAYNPKPWQTQWTPYALRWYDQLIALVEWCEAQKLLPEFAPLPPTLQRKNERFFRLCAPLAPHWHRVKKLWRKLGL